MKCPQCGFENKEGALYCANCGTKLPVEEPEVKDEEVKPEEKPEEKKEESDGISIMALHRDPEPVETREVTVHVKPVQDAEVKTQPQPAPEPEPKPAAVIQEPVEAEIPKEPEEELSAKEQRQKEIKNLPRRYRPISMWGYLIYLLLLSCVPYVIGALLVKYYSGAVTGSWKTVLSISGPLLHALFLLFFSFVPRNVNVRAFARAWFIFLVIIVLVLVFTGNLEQVIAFLESFPKR